MKTSTALLFLTLCSSSMLLSQAFFFGDNMWPLMYMMNSQSSQGTGGMGNGMPLFLLASGSDKMKTMGQGLLLSSMFSRNNNQARGTGRTQ